MNNRLSKSIKRLEKLNLIKSKDKVEKHRDLSAYEVKVFRQLRDKYDLSVEKNEISSTRTGIIIQKKFVKLAVNRNYIKRKFREIIMRSKLNSFDVVLMVKNKIEEFDKLKVKKNFIDLESKIEKI